MTRQPILGGRSVLDGRKVVIFGPFISVELLYSVKTGLSRELGRDEARLTGAASRGRDISSRGRDIKARLVE